MIGTGGEDDALVDLFDAAACGLLRTTGDGTIVRANAMMASWCGHAAEELAGRRFQSLLSAGSRLFHQTHWMPLLQMQGSVAEVQLELMHRDGRTLPMIVNAFARRGEDGNPTHRIDVAAIIATDRRKYERELLRARRRAEELLTIVRNGEAAARERAAFAEQLVGIVSHDLRNPLHAIVLGTQVLERAGLSDFALRTTSRITAAAHRANRLIGDLLDFTQARLGAGIGIERREVDLHEIAGGCADEVRLATPHRHLEHERAGGGTLHADPDRLAQVVTNLLANAVAYGAPDAPILLVTTVAEDGARIAVHNRGPSIPEDLLPHIFEPMRRGDAGSRPPRSASSRSVGLGLYIVSEIVRGHGGSVAVRSNDAEGTTFTVSLPTSPSTLQTA